MEDQSTADDLSIDETGDDLDSSDILATKSTKDPSILPHIEQD